MIKFLQIGALDNLRYYKGKRDGAVTGLHEQTIELICLPNAHILDVGSYDGALAARLEDKGFVVDTVDIAGKPTYKIDLNNFSWEIPNKYDYIIACEVIEHLENPRAFLRNISKCLKSSGTIILSTPNIENPISKLRFLMGGKFSLFDDDALVYGHITPISSFQMKTHIEAAGLKLFSIVPGGIYPIIYWNNRVKDSLIWSLVSILSFPFSTNMNTCNIFVCTKKYK
jgi:2-polyprenyl-3-methyl-5-hydroxy-6-metoxy-1,4-benzoquinol methylase